MRVAIWLALRDVSRRWGRTLLAAVVVATVTAAGVGMELLALGRERSVAERMDAIGPPLTVLAKGATSGDLARLDLGTTVLADGVARGVHAVLGADLARIESRTVGRGVVDGLEAIVVGVATTREGGAELGAELARRLRAPPSIRVGQLKVKVSAVRPSTGDVEDLAVFLPRAAARRAVGIDRDNVLGIYLRAGVSPRDAEARLLLAGLAAAVVRTDRGEVADGGAHESLARHRRGAQLVLSVMAVLCLLMAAHLDTSERRVEIATLMAMGAPRPAIVGAVVSRSAFVGIAGAVAGTLAALTFSAAHETGAVVAAPDLQVGAVAVLAAFLAGIGAAAPTAFLSAARNPIPDLQEAS